MIAVDTHAHVFERGLKLAEKRRYTPDYDAPLDAYLYNLDRSGISHGVLVQPSFLGTDNNYLLKALDKFPDRLRGIAVVEPGTSKAELIDLASNGVVGIRLNLPGTPLPDLNCDLWTKLLHHISGLGWQVEVHLEACDLSAIVGVLLDTDLNVVIDHFGRPDKRLGIDDPGFRYLLSVAKTRRVWVKLSGAYRIGNGCGAGETASSSLIPSLRESFGLDRLLWGSDWPHTQFESATDYSTAWAQLETWLPDPEERKIVLEEAPMQLFKFS